MAVALLVAAGSGERLGSDGPKAFVVLAGRPMLEWSVAALRAAAIEQIVVALPPGEAAPAGCLGVAGGATRSESVRAGARGGAARRAGRRPRRRPPARAAAPLRRHAAALAGADAAIVAARVPDTVKEAGEDRLVTATLDRSRLWAIQTPQAFRRDVLERALDVDAATLARATDDAWLVERAGGTVRVVESTPENFKVTTPHDLKVAELLLRERSP